MSKIDGPIARKLASSHAPHPTWEDAHRACVETAEKHLATIAERDAEIERLKAGIQKALDTPPARAWILEHTLLNGKDNCCGGRCQGHGVEGESALQSAQKETAREIMEGINGASDTLKATWTGDENILATAIIEGIKSRYGVE